MGAQAAPPDVETLVDAQAGATVLAPRNYGGEWAKHWRSRRHSRLQVVETVNGLLEDVFHLHFRKPRSVWELLSTA